MTAGHFQHFIGIDWSGAKGQYQKGLAVARALNRGDVALLEPRTNKNYWSRTDIFRLLAGLPKNRRTLVGIDSGFSLPFLTHGSFLPGARNIPTTAKKLWSLVHDLSDPDFYPKDFVGQFQDWFHHTRASGHVVKGPKCAYDLRLTETVCNAGLTKARSETIFKLIGPSQVGKSALSTMAMLAKLAHQPDIAIWPFDPIEDVAKANVVVVELFASLFSDRAGHRGKVRRLENLLAIVGHYDGKVRDITEGFSDDQSDALIMAAGLRAYSPQEKYWQPPQLSPKVARTEGWIFGTA